mmetsp:Transcript_9491/g.28655  ORF Transcript_9491/g.28655 Transcript_9491/m.28655 type:complete len:235 (+) Transcript_9491:171-875(+)
MRGGVSACFVPTAAAGARRRRTVAAAEFSAGRVAIQAAAVSLGATLLNRLFGTSAFTDAQSRADLLCVASGAMLLMYGIANVDVDARVEEEVQLEGEEVFEASGEGDGAKFLRWIGSAIPAAVPNIKSVVLYLDGRTLLRAGTAGSNSEVKPGPIVNKTTTTGEKGYFAKLEILPGRFEFDYLPGNTQAVLVQPVGNRGALILGANKVRPLTPVDFGWIAAICDHIIERFSVAN